VTEAQGPPTSPPTPGCSHPPQGLGTCLIESGLVGSTDFLSSHLAGRVAASAEDAQGTPTQSHISSRVLAYEDNDSAFGIWGLGFRVGGTEPQGSHHSPARGSCELSRRN